MKKVQDFCRLDEKTSLVDDKHIDGLALVNAADGVVGYCLCDNENKTIREVALLPEYGEEQTKLLLETVKYTKAREGQWQVCANDDAMLKGLERLSKRGLIEMEQQGAMVTFTPLKAEDRVKNMKARAEEKQQASGALSAEAAKAESQTVARGKINADTLRRWRGNSLGS